MGADGWKQEAVPHPVAFITPGAADSAWRELKTGREGGDHRDTRTRGAGPSQAGLLAASCPGAAHRACPTVPDVSPGTEAVL